MVTGQLHIPIDVWLSGKISIGPRRDPQIMNDFQMQVTDVRGSSGLHHFSCTSGSTAGGFYYSTAYPNHPISALLCTTDQRRIQYSTQLGPPSTAGTLNVPGLTLTHPESVCFLPEAMGSTGERIWTT